MRQIFFTFAPVTPPGIAPCRDAWALMGIAELWGHAFWLREASGAEQISLSLEEGGVSEQAVLPI